MESRKMFSMLLSLNAYGAITGENRRSSYRPQWEKLRMKGMSAEEIGTANSRKKSKRERMKRRSR